MPRDRWDAKCRSSAPPSLHSIRTPHLPVMQHAVEWLAANDDYRPDLVLILQPTSPLRRAEHVREAVSARADVRR